MKTIVVASNPLEPETYRRFDNVENVMDFLMARYPVWDNTIKIYLNIPSEATDITPVDLITLEKLNDYEGVYIVIENAGAPAVIAIVVAVVVGVAVALMMPMPAVPTQRNTQSTSPNNELASRTNRPRPNSRIVDVYGEGRCTFDLLAAPYTIFINHQEVEHAFMCATRGFCQVDPDEVRDDTTRISQIIGSSVEFYAPFTSPNSGHAPQLRIGSPINIPIDTVTKSNSVNGQVARAPNDLNYNGDNNLVFAYPNVINSTGDVNLTETFQNGDVLLVENAVFTSPFNHLSSGVAKRGAASDYAVQLATHATSLVEPYNSATKIKLENCTITVSGTSYSLNGEYDISSKSFDTVGTQNFITFNLTNAATVNANWSQLAASSQVNTDSPFASKITSSVSNFNLNGEYVITTVAENQITLNAPSTVNANWNAITETNPSSARLTTSGDKWIGPFILDDVQTTGIHCNFVAANGLYKDNGSNQYSADVTVEVEVTPVDADDNPTGAAILQQATLIGSSVVRSTRAVTLNLDGLVASRYSVRCRRVSPTDTGFEGTVVDEIRWRDLYSHSPITMTHFGNVTTVQSITFATTGALTLKERKLNGKLTRLVRTFDGTTVTEEINPSKSAVDIFLTVLLDQYIGNRTVDEIDLENLYEVYNDIVEYFGTTKAAEFSYTFDTDNMSLEETLKTIANAIFCEPYRLSNVTRLFFEKLTEDSVLLFNHRNKFNENRQITTGTFNKYDGVNYQWVDPKDDALVTMYIPADQSATNPKTVESVGIRNATQAHFQAYRVWNKIKHQHITADFEATQEGELLIKGNRILNTNSTIAPQQEGYIIRQDVLVLTLSQPVKMISGVNYSIMLQMSDASVEIMPVYPTTNPKQVILDHAPRLPLVLDAHKYLQTQYIITEVGKEKAAAFLVTYRAMGDNMTTKITAINYSDRYYSNDSDFKNNIIS